MRRVCVTSELGTVWQIRILVPKGLEARDFSRVSVHFMDKIAKNIFEYMKVRAII